MERALIVFRGLSNIVAIPLLLLNLVGGIASAIWLMILAEWWALGYGLVGLFGGAIVLSLAFLPGMIFMIPISSLAERGQKFPVFVLGFLSNVYMGIVLTIWCVAVFAIFMNRADSSSFWPLLIWSYGIAVAPVMYMASKERDNWVSQMTTFYVQVAYLCMMITVILFSVTLVDLAVVCGVVMFLGFTFSWYLLMASGELSQFGRSRGR